MKKTVIEEFEIDEMSSVDRPAQKHALAVIMKRDEGVMRKRDEGEKHEHGGRDMTLIHKAEEIRRKTGCSSLTALREARTLYPDEFKKYQEAAEEPEAFNKLAGGSHAQKSMRFRQAVHELMMRDKKLTGPAAMREIRKTRPELFEALQSAD